MEEEIKTLQDKIQQLEATIKKMSKIHEREMSEVHRAIEDLEQKIKNFVR